MKSPWFVLLVLLIFGGKAQAQAGESAVACGALSGQDCREQALRAQFGFGANQDLSRALNLFEAACDEGDLPSCTELGVAFVLGIGVRRDEDKARPFFAKGCSTELAENCHGHGMSYLNPNNPVQNLLKAATILTQACWSGSAEGCFVVARINHLGDNGKQPLTGLPDSLLFYQEACRLGAAETCWTVPDLIQQTPELSLYAHVAERMLRLGCEVHEATEACTRLKP